MDMKTQPFRRPNLSGLAAAQDERRRIFGDLGEIRVLGADDEAIINVPNVLRRQSRDPPASKCNQSLSAIWSAQVYARMDDNNLCMSN